MFISCPRPNGWWLVVELGQEPRRPCSKGCTWHPELDSLSSFPVYIYIEQHTLKAPSSPSSACLCCLILFSYIKCKLSKNYHFEILQHLPEEQGSDFELSGQTLFTLLSPTFQLSFPRSSAKMGHLQLPSTLYLTSSQFWNRIDTLFVYEAAKSIPIH